MRAYLYDGNQELFRAFAVPDPPPPNWLVPRRRGSPVRFKRIGVHVDTIIGDYAVYLTQDVMTPPEQP